MSTRMNEIEARTRRYADCRAKVTEIVTALEEARSALMKTELPKLRRAIASAAAAHDELKALVEDSADLFEKPKTQTFHGIRVGYKKGVGKIEFDDADRVVALIEKCFPEQADVLVATTKKPVKDALTQLTAAELKRLGVTVTEAGEAVFIKPVDGAVDKLVEALMKAATEEAA